MRITELSITGAFEVTPEIHGDMRGAFLEWFREDRFTKSVGHPFTVAQANSSPPRRTARGRRCCSTTGNGRRCTSERGSGTR